MLILSEIYVIMGTSCQDINHDDMKRIYEV